MLFKKKLTATLFICVFALYTSNTLYCAASADAAEDFSALICSPRELHDAVRTHNLPKLQHIFSTCRQSISLEEIEEALEDTFIYIYANPKAALDEMNAHPSMVIRRKLKEEFLFKLASTDREEKSDADWEHLIMRATQRSQASRQISDAEILRALEDKLSGLSTMHNRMPDYPKNLKPTAQKAARKIPTPARVAQYAVAQENGYAWYNPLPLLIKTRMALLKKLTAADAYLQSRGHTWLAAIPTILAWFIS